MLGCQVPGHRTQLAGGLAAADGLLQLLPGDPEGDLYHQRRRVVELLPAQTAQNAWGLSQRRFDYQNTFSCDQPGGQEMDDADPRLEIGAQSVRHPVRRQGAGMNTSYTVNLTPPKVRYQE